MKKILIVLFVALPVLIFFAPYPLGPREPVRVEIPPGTPAGQVARILAEDHLISHRLFFVLLSRLTFSGEKIQAGTYQFNPPVSEWHLLRALRSGQTVKIKLTVPEGAQALDIAELVEGQHLGTVQKFMALVKKRALEGYLFPETYLFEESDREEEIVQRMQEQFRKHFTDDFKTRAREIGMTERQVVTLASIIEKEAKIPEERPVISSVYHNRLKRHMPLGADPTIQYALGRWHGRLYYKHLKIDSPYNTYKYAGLPPGPICSPGLESLRAALYPQQTNYLFFVADGSGHHHFSVTSAEHSRAVKQRDALRDGGSNP